MIVPKRLRKAKAKSSKEILNRLEEYLKSVTVTGEFVKILCGFWEDQQNAITYQELRQIVQDGSVEQETLRLWTQDYSILVANQLNDMWMDAIIAGSKGQPILDNLTFGFNSQSSGILNWIKERGAEFVTSSSQEQKNAIAALLTKKMKDGHTVDELSRLIRPCIGLTESDAKAAVRFYDNIVANLRKDHPRMKLESIRRKALDATQIYAERKHRARAMTIAQTESAFAYNRGTDEGIRQAQAAGYLGAMRKKWSTSGDDAVCGLCNSLDGVEIDMDAEFDIKGKILFPGHHLMPPAHPRCACAVEYIEMEPPIFYPEDQEISSIQENIESVVEPVYLGALENVSDDVVKSTLEEYELKIAESSVENAVIITKTGLMWQCFGDNNFVPLSSELGIDLSGASITHNHPVNSVNEYSFSDYDINFFIENDLKILRGIDERYIYELSRVSFEVDDHATLDELMKSDGDLARHEHVIEIAQRLKIGYRRWQR